MNYQKYMQIAIDEAKKGIGFVAPNPLVGAVIVKDDNIIGVGYHQRYGENHAEVNAILDAKKHNKDIKNSTIYVTLEPCSHYGKTPPCADAIIKEGIKKVVIGCTDTNSLVAGRGIEKLKEAGIEVVENILEDECNKLNEVFFHYINSKKPFIVMKYAMTMDGKIATSSGKSKWISNSKSRESVHYFRKQYSAIMVGINTVINDNPMLDCRIENPRNPIRIILDSSLKIDLSSNICKTAKDIKTYIATISDDEKKIKSLENLGIAIIKTSALNNRVNIKELINILGRDKNIDSILVDGGASVNASLLKEKLVNKILIYIAPKIFGGFSSKAPISDIDIDDPNNAILLVDGVIKNIDNDLFLEYYLDYKNY